MHYLSVPQLRTYIERANDNQMHLPKLKEKRNLRGKTDLKFSLPSYAEFVFLSDGSLLIWQRSHIKMQEVKCYCTQTAIHSPQQMGTSD